MKPGLRLSELKDATTASGILDDFELKVLGVPVEVHAYRDILGTLGVGGYRSETVAGLGVVDYGEDHFTCFEFHYDWRRDCAENAALLKTTCRNPYGRLTNSTELWTFQASRLRALQSS